MGQTKSIDCCSRAPGDERKKDDSGRQPLMTAPSTEKFLSSSMNSVKVRDHFKTHENLFTRLVAHKQDHIFENVDELKDNELERFYDSLYDIDFEMMDMMYNHLILNPQDEELNPEQIDHIEPIKNKSPLGKFSEDEYLKLRRHGLELILSGKVAILLLSGGEGTTLAFQHPKGMLKVGSLSGKTLFECLANKILRLCQIACETFDVTQTKPPIHWYIMTNEMNKEEIKLFFIKNSYFGFTKTNIHFFSQQSLPAVDFYGKIILDGKSSLHMAPNGTGGMFLALSKNKIIDDMKTKGIKYIHTFGVDNPLIKPADPFLLGFADVNNNNVTCKYITRKENDEEGETFVLQKGKPRVVSLSKLPSEIAQSRDSRGNPLHGANYTLNVVYSLNFLENVIKNGRKELVKNYHVTKKKMKYYDKNLKETVTPLDINGYTFELFDYDAFSLARPENFGLLEIKPEEEFAPIKNPPGSTKDNAERSTIALSLLHQRWLQNQGVRFDQRATGVSGALLEIDCAQIYDEWDPNLEKLGKKYRNRILKLPAFVKELAFDIEK